MPAMPQIHPAPRFDLRLTADQWAFAAANRRDIDGHWRQETARNPHLFNGKVLLAHRSGFRPDGTFYGDHVAVDFDAFLAWRDWGFDAGSGRNIFGAALIRPLEGDFIMGRMAAHTSNAGRIYPPSGTLDLGDVASDGSIDIEASMRRELFEETGLVASTLIEGDAYIIIEDVARICVARIFHTAKPAAETLAQIRAGIAADPDAELDDAVHVRKGDHMPDEVFLPYVKTIISTLG
jgi:8-oxo-dGTP pyrophosphatase MutT (NUDIX family)